MRTWGDALDFKVRRVVFKWLPLHVQILGYYYTSRFSIWMQLRVFYPPPRGGGIDKQERDCNSEIMCWLVEVTIFSSIVASINLNAIGTGKRHSATTTRSRPGHRGSRSDPKTKLLSLEAHLLLGR